MIELGQHGFSRRQLLKAAAAAGVLWGSSGGIAWAAPTLGNLPQLRVPGVLRALEQWQGRWWALVGALDADTKPDVVWMSSPDRAAWTAGHPVVSKPGDVHVHDLIASNGLIAVGWTTDTIIGGTVTTASGQAVPLRTRRDLPLVVTSRDGRVWVKQNLPPGPLGMFTAIAGDGRGRLLAVGSRFSEPGVRESFGGLAAVSTDGGATWSWLPASELETFPEGRVTSLAFAQGRYVAAAATTSGPRLYVSADASSWNAMPPPALSHGEELALVAGDETELIVGAVGLGGARLWRSDPLGKWTPASVPAPFSRGRLQLGGSTRPPDADLTVLGAGAGTSAFAPLTTRRS